MYFARLICSDEDCAERVLAEAETVEQLDALACECGCAYQVLGVPDFVEEARAVVIPLRRRSQSLGEAA